MVKNGLPLLGRDLWAPSDVSWVDPLRLWSESHDGHKLLPEVWKCGRSAYRPKAHTGDRCIWCKSSSIRTISRDGECICRDCGTVLGWGCYKFDAKVLVPVSDGIVMSKVGYSSSLKSVQLLSDFFDPAAVDELVKVERGSAVGTLRSLLREPSSDARVTAQFTAVGTKMGISQFFHADETSEDFGKGLGWDEYRLKMIWMSLRNRGKEKQMRKWQTSTLCSSELLGVTACSPLSILRVLYYASSLFINCTNFVFVDLLFYFARGLSNIFDSRQNWSIEKGNASLRIIHYKFFFRFFRVNIQLTSRNTLYRHFFFQTNCTISKIFSFCLGDSRKHGKRTNLTGIQFFGSPFGPPGDRRDYCYRRWQLTLRHLYPVTTSIRSRFRMQLLSYPNDLDNIFVFLGECTLQ